MLDSTNANGELPEGQHLATLDEVEKFFGSSSERRRKLMRGLWEAAANSKEAGVKRIWINGSFVTDKENPGDIDGCWEYGENVDISTIDPVFLQDDGISAVKEKYGLDFYLADDIELSSGIPFTKFFQINRDGINKGIIFVNLGD